MFIADRRIILSPAIAMITAVFPINPNNVEHIKKVPTAADHDTEIKRARGEKSYGCWYFMRIRWKYSSSGVKYVPESWWKIDEGDGGSGVKLGTALFWPVVAANCWRKYEVEAAVVAAINVELMLMLMARAVVAVEVNDAAPKGNSAFMTVGN